MSENVVGKVSLDLSSSGDASHYHKKYTATVVNPLSILLLPDNEHFIMSRWDSQLSPVQDSLQVYVSGILQTNGVHFKEIPSGSDIAQGIGVDFMEEILEPGEVITLEWVVRN